MEYGLLLTKLPHIYKEKIYENYAQHLSTSGSNRIILRKYEKYRINHHNVNKNIHYMVRLVLTDPILHH